VRRPAGLAAVTLAFGLFVAACGSDDDNRMMDGGGHMGSSRHDEPSDVAAGARRVEVTGTSFEFDPAEIRVEAGEDVAIVLTSEDILHDFTIDELDAHVSAGPGETEEGGFTAGGPGRSTYYCSVNGHREAGMEGTLVVE
jgi:plastocyanin